MTGTPEDREKTKRLKSLVDTLASERKPEMRAEALWRAEVHSTQKRPPDRVWSAIENQFNQEIIATHPAWKRILRPGVMGVALAGAAGVAAIFLYLMPAHQLETPALADLKQGRRTFARDTVLEAPGMRLSHKQGTEVTLESGPRNHYSIRSGVLDANLNHKALTKKIWFWFAGGGVQPLGTRFRIEAGPKKAVVTLEEGKLLLIQSGRPANPRVLRPGARITSRGDIPAAGLRRKLSKQARGSLATGQGSENPARENPKNKKTLSKPAPSAGSKTTPKVNSPYQQYLGKKVRLHLDNGNKNSGLVTSLKGGVVTLKSGLGVLKIPAERIIKVEVLKPE